MKKTFLIIVSLFSFFVLNAQNKTKNKLNSFEKKNELKLNIPFIFLGTFEATYERILNEKSSLGISTLYVFNNENSNEDVNFMLSPYYRRYFGKKIASGFFAEGFGMVSSIDGKKNYDTEDNSTFTKGSDVIDLSVGVGLGAKWITKSGIIFEINAGLGKLLFNADKIDHDQVARFGFQLGYRF